MKLIFNPGTNSSSVMLGLSPAITDGTRVVTTRNNITAVVKVTVSRKLGILRVINIPIEPNKGIEIAQSIVFPSITDHLR